MEFKRGDTVWLKDDECLGLVMTVDDSDGTYRVWIEDEDWEWVSEKQVSRPPAPVYGPVLVGTNGAPLTGKDIFGMPLGQRMQYDNSSPRRKDQPVTEGFLDYFPATARLTAELSRLGNEKHNPGEPLHHARGKSKDHRNCAVRHLMDADVIDPETGLVEAVGAVWRSSAYVQELAENVYGWPKAPRAR